MNERRRRWFIIIVCMIAVLAIVSFCLVSARVSKQTSEYYISSVEDLVQFRDEVNAGNTFEGITVYQTKDIDMSGVSNWIPIGVSGSGNYFYGSYNGLGHKIKNLRSALCDESSDNGLFGSLGGKVYNLAVVDAYINGGCLGGIASSSADGDAVIFNCYVKARFEGTRGGAIADNFVGGKVVSCWADCSYVGNSDEVPLVSYDAISITRCYTTGKICESKTYTGTLSDNQKVLASYYKTDEFADALNDNLFFICLNNYTTYNTLVSWKNSWSGVCFDRQCGSITSLTFEGKGTKASPYLISSLRDLAVFACGVNEGRSFGGYWLRQTCDFDLSCLDSWLPIGVYNSNCYFYGTYDGGGHKIYNLYCEDSGRSRNNGFFGMLGGTVINLGIESGEIYGECCGGIASHAAVVRANIINCYSKANIHGYARSGGVADNFIGRIENCVYYGESRSVPLVSYHADYLIHTFTNTYNYNRYTFQGRAKQCYVYGQYAYGEWAIGLEDMAAELNSYLATAAARIDCEASDLFSWKVEGDSVTFDMDSVTYPEADSGNLTRVLQVGGIALALAEAGVLYYFLIYRRERKKSKRLY